MFGYKGKRILRYRKKFKLIKNSILKLFNLYTIEKNKWNGYLLILNLFFILFYFSLFSFLHIFL